MTDRREMLQWAVFTAAAAAVVGPARAAGPVEPVPGIPAGKTSISGRSLGPIGLGWSLTHAAAPVAGAITLSLAHDDGRAVRVDLCLRDGALKGPAGTEFLDFIVMDGGNGSVPVDESLGRALRLLASDIERVESQHLHELAQLESHDERLWRYPDAVALTADSTG